MKKNQKPQALPASENEQIACNRREIFAALKTAGVKRAVVSYAGSGDSGGPEEVSFEMPDGSPFTKKPKLYWCEASWVCVNKNRNYTLAWTKRPLDEVVMDFAMDVVEQHYAGWENDDGASGEVIFETAAGTVRMDHTSYYTESERTEVLV